MNSVLTTTTNEPANELPWNNAIAYRNFFANLVYDYLEEHKLPFKDLIVHAQDIFGVAYDTAGAILLRRTKHPSTLQKIEHGIEKIASSPTLRMMFMTLYHDGEIPKELQAAYKTYFETFMKRIHLKRHAGYMPKKPFYTKRMPVKTTAEWRRFNATVRCATQDDTLTEQEIQLLALYTKHKKPLCGLDVAPYVSGYSHGTGLGLLADIVSKKLNRYTSKNYTYHLVLINNTLGQPKYLEQYEFKYERRTKTPPPGRAKREPRVYISTERR